MYVNTYLPSYFTHKVLNRYFCLVNKPEKPKKKEKCLKKSESNEILQVLQRNCNKNWNK